MRLLLQILREWLCSLVVCRRRPAFYLAFSLSPGFAAITHGVIIMRLTTEQFALATLVALTASGNVAAIDGDPTFTSSDENVARIERQEDGSFRVIAVGQGVAQIAAIADADLDDGEVREITATGAIEVVAPEAASLELQFGEPQQL